MLMDITEAFKSMVKSVGWMNDKTKKATLGKVTAITNYIGYPDWLFKPGELEKLYHGVSWNHINQITLPLAKSFEEKKNELIFYLRRETKFNM